MRSDVLATIGYSSRDNAGNPLSMTDWTGSWAYGYDANSRLTTATPPQPIPDQPAGGPYGYDWVGNRLNPPTGTNHMVYNAADQLIAWPGMHQYTYYGDGSLQEERSADGSQKMKSYTYTADGLLDEAEFDFTTPTVRRYLENTWDADRNRVKYESGVKADSILTPQYRHTFVYYAAALIPAVLKEDGIYYVREPSGALLARVDGSSLSYYHFDDLGSTRMLTGASGSVTDKYDYDAYGAVIAHEKLAGSVDQPYQYVGQLGYYTCWQEPDLGLLQTGVRFLSLVSNAYTQHDKLWTEVASAYVYASGSPVSVVDPWGLSPCPKSNPCNRKTWLFTACSDKKAKDCVKAIGKYMGAKAEDTCLYIVNTCEQVKDPVEHFVPCVEWYINLVEIGRGKTKLPKRPPW